jgi:hypothetical protein
MTVRIKRSIVQLKNVCVLSIKNEHVSFKHCYVFNEMSETTVGIKRNVYSSLSDFECERITL